MADIRQAVAADWPGVRRLFSRFFRFNPLLQRPDYLDWQFNDPALNGDDGIRLHLFEEEGRIGACLGFVPLAMRIGDWSGTGLWPMTWASASNGFGGLVLFDHLMKRRRPMVFMAPNPQSRPVYERYRLSFQERMPRWVGVLDPAAVAGMMTGPTPGDRERLHWSRQRLSGLSTSPAVAHSHPERAGGEISFAQWPEIRAHGRRTETFLAWRYGRIPHHDYHMIEDDRGQMAIYRLEPVMDAPHQVARLVEWTFRDGAEAAMALLCRQWSRQGVVLVDFFCSAPVVGRVLEGVGLFPERATSTPIPDQFRPLNHSGGIPLAFGAGDQELTPPLTAGDWYITRGDGDLDRFKR